MSFCAESQNPQEGGSDGSMDPATEAQGDKEERILRGVAESTGGGSDEASSHM